MNNTAQEWVDASTKLRQVSEYFTFDVQQLWYVEIMILDMGQRVKIQQERQQEPGYDLNSDPEIFLTTQLVALSKYWTFGMYELLRKLREIISPKDREFVAPYSSFEPLFRRVELVRMPLAKYEAAKIKGSLHWPEIVLFSETGSCGWKVYDKRSGDMVVIPRYSFSKDFLWAAKQVELP